MANLSKSYRAAILRRCGILARGSRDDLKRCPKKDRFYREQCKYWYEKANRQAQQCVRAVKRGEKTTAVEQLGLASNSSAHGFYFQQKRVK